MTEEFKRPHARQAANFFLLLDWHYGSPAVWGYLATLELLRQFKVTQGEPEWLVDTLGAIEDRGHDVVGDYVTNYLTSPEAAITRILDPLQGFPFHNYMSEWEYRWGEEFTVGAVGIIGLLIFLEENPVRSLSA